MDTAQDRLMHLVREALAFALYTWRRFSADNGLRIAASLSYTSLLALVPLIAIAVAIMSAFPVFEAARSKLGAVALDYVAPHVGALAQEYVDTFVSNTAQLTAVGVVGLAVTAVMLLANIEGAFNIIWRVNQARPFVTRLIAYWTVLTLGPLMLGTGLSLSTFFFAAANWAGVDVQTGAFRELARQGLPLLLAAGSFTVLYIALPHRRVDWRHALGGGAFAAILFEVLKRGFGFYVGNVRTFDAVYGTVSALPLFLIWMYLGWAVILMGAVAAASWPDWRANKQRRAEVTVSREAMFVASLMLIERLWLAGRNSQVLDEKEIPADNDAAAPALRLLMDAGFIARTDTDKLTLVRDLDTLSVRDIYRTAGLGSDLSSLPADAQQSWHGRLREMLTRADQGEHAALALPVKALFAESEPARMAAGRAGADSLGDRSAS